MPKHPRGLSRMARHKQKLTKSIFLVILIAMVALIAPSTVSAQSSGGTATTCHPNPNCDNASFPVCSMAAACPLSRPNAAIVAPPSSNDHNVCKTITVRLPVNIVGDPSVDQDITTTGDDTPRLSVTTGASYIYCRNSLSSEEPPLI